MSNAIKFTHEQSKVTLNAAIVDSHIIIVIVRDEGDGIPADYGDKVFDKFYQLQETGNNQSVGTGLGLPISRHFAEFHDGTLDLMHDGHGKGACFKLTIPLKTQEEHKYES